MKIKDKVVVVTGGGNGIGREVVLSLLTKGARVAAIDVSELGLKETSDLANAGDRLITCTVNITDRAAVLGLPARIRERFTQVDALVNVAGIVHDFKPVAALDFAAIERVMAVNFWGTVNLAKAFLPLLEVRPEASLVNVASMGSLVPFPGQSAYGASKAAVKLFTEGLIAEHQGTSLKVSIVFPGGIATSILDNSGVTGPAMSSDDVAPASARLTSPRAAARLIVGAVETGKPRVLIGSDAKLLDRLSRLMPARAIPMIAKRMRDLAR
ncbi:NAD(P)-dependent dehydrogenase (short-subunit alcohol dehydrogenase family) [Kribbella aluminosa]|uniref:NAD(P)-dependent dehydrogenase (Short-subunit alcohol dehydrogenase family) n=1 Tax=Kribbella aluminosa TaxID=416017 RepID=A0ABS4UJ57_9ACTN|nr:SDR family NAD(P)-dependent oxidoreductase [Kribbella aluminosa]MBP2351697.1 NAD(P)-dependent dehydrogenase (short-subunit alcohol dehydrogenase family) [Kribbella aluminosa]